MTTAPTRNGASLSKDAPARSEAAPLTEDGSGVRVWGVPISTEWWREQWANAEARYRLTSLCLGDESMARGGPGRFTGLAAMGLAHLYLTDRRAFDRRMERGRQCFFGPPSGAHAAYLRSKGIID